MSLLSASLNLDTQTQITPQKPAESVLQCAEPHLHIIAGYHSWLCVQQLHGTVNCNHFTNNLCDNCPELQIFALTAGI